MHHLRRTITLIAGLAISLLGVAAAAPSAFAMRLVPNDGAGTSTAASPTTHSGVNVGELALIVIGVAALAAVAVTAFVVIRRVRPRQALHSTPR